MVMLELYMFSNRHCLLQGLSATPEQLGANAAATATEFETFEDLLSLSTTGGGKCRALGPLVGLLLCSTVGKAD
jgi:hypothetical protein